MLTISQHPTGAPRLKIMELAQNKEAKEANDHREPFGGFGEFMWFGVEDRRPTLVNVD